MSMKGRLSFLGMHLTSLHFASFLHIPQSHVKGLVIQPHIDSLNMIPRTSHPSIGDRKKQSEGSATLSACPVT